MDTVKVTSSEQKDSLDSGSSDFLTIVGLLWSVPVPEVLAINEWVNFATLMLIPVFIFYARLSLSSPLG